MFLTAQYLAFLMREPSFRGVKWANKPLKTSKCLFDAGAIAGAMKVVKQSDYGTHHLCFNFFPCTGGRALKIEVANYYQNWQSELPVHGFIAKFVVVKVPVKIDSSGRISIPQQIRKAQGYVYGTELNLVMELSTDYIIITSMVKKVDARPVMTIDEWGIPTFEFRTGEVMRYNFTEAIRNDHTEKRSLFHQRNLKKQRS